MLWWMRPDIGIRHTTAYVRKVGPGPLPRDPVQRVLDRLHPSSPAPDVRGASMQRSAASLASSGAASSGRRGPARQPGSVNSASHLGATARHQGPDTSSNLWWVDTSSSGEGLAQQPHAFPTSGPPWASSGGTRPDLWCHPYPWDPRARPQHQAPLGPNQRRFG